MHYIAILKIYNYVCTRTYKYWWGLPSIGQSPPVGVLHTNPTQSLTSFMFNKKKIQ